MARSKNDRSAWVQAGLSALASEGPDAVRVERLASTLGVTKGGFYGHFAGRRALLDAMLDRWEEASTVAVTDRLTEMESDPGSAVVLAAELTWSPEGLTGVDMAIRAWARYDVAVAERLARVDGFRFGYLRAGMETICPDPDEALARSVLAYTSAIGMQYAGISLEEMPQAVRAAKALITLPGRLT